MVPGVCGTGNVEGEEVLILRRDLVACREQVVLLPRPLHHISLVQAQFMRSQTGESKIRDLKWNENPGKVGTGDIEERSRIRPRYLRITRQIFYKVLSSYAVVLF
jgi:hypothetical protein